MPRCDAIVLGTGAFSWLAFDSTFTEFHRLPGTTPERDNVLDRGDLIVAVEVPPRIEGHASHYFKLRDRQSYEFALASAAAAVDSSGDRHI